jgi:predicted MFS family arabinose efflux permease
MDQPTPDTQETRPPKATFGSILAHRAVRALWVASLISYVGDTFTVMALFILVNTVTGSTVTLAAVGVVQTLPLFIGVLAGVLVDRWRYRPVLLLTDLLRAALIPLYLLFHTPADLSLVLVVTLLVATAGRFFVPASMALRRALLQPHEYQVAAALWQATYGLSFVIGPALAGVIIGVFGTSGITVALLVDSVSFALSAAIVFVGVRQEAQTIDADRQAEAPRSAWADLREGWAIMAQSRPLRGVLLLYGVGLLGVGAVFVLVVPYIQRLFGGGPFEIGLFETAQAFGLALGAVGVGTVAAARFSAGSLMLGASLVGGLAVVALGLAPLYGAALAAMLLAGVAAGTVQSAGAAVTLHVIPQRHQGKGQAAINTLLNAAYVTSMALAGAGGDTVGIRAVFVAGGVIAFLGVMAATPWLWGAVPPNSAAVPSVPPDAGEDVTRAAYAGETPPM